jgi:hypothetical protein
MKILKLLPFIFLFFFSQCNITEEPEDIRGVNDFMNEVLNIMETHAIHRYDIDWVEFRSLVLNQAAGKERIGDADDALLLALEMLNTNHSFIRKPNGTVLYPSNLSCRTNDLPTFTLPNDVGYVKVNGYTSGTSFENIAFAQDIQDNIRNQDHSNIKGWIVDLRNNTGGNMWPMLAGIGPVLGEGVAGYFIDPDSIQQVWSYSNGASQLESNSIIQVADFYELVNPNPKVAVLLNGAIGSSGEAITIAFIGRPNTKSFGVATCGLSTANTSFTLSNGYILNLTTAYMADRNQVIYGQTVTPDTAVSDNNIIQAAIDYIQN